MNVVRVAWVAVLIASVAVPASAALEEMARAGRWRQLLETANRRSEQLPLRPDEAFVAAAAARALGERALEERYLTLAGEGEPFAELARLELAELVVAEDPVRAVELALPTGRRAPTFAMREAAVEVAVAAASGGVVGDTRRALEQLVAVLPRSLRRPLELALAASDGADARHRLGRLLAESTRDLEALEAARLLRELPDLTGQERWWVAQALYRHALYSDTEPILESLDGVDERTVERWQVAFLHGRCAFRQGRWSEAAERYGTASRWVRGAEQAADLEVHRARALELAGMMDEAVAAAQVAVRLRTTDERRLFLARLRLRLDQPELALAGIARIRDRSARARGELLVALYELRTGRRVDARKRLQGIRRPPWQGPAAVLAARLAVDERDWDGAQAVLEAAAASLEPFEAELARDLMGRLPAERLAAWRERRTAALEGPPGRSRRRTVAQGVVLEPDPVRIAELRRVVAREVGLEEAEETPSFDPGLAAELWRRGLFAQAARWDPGGMPQEDPASTAWTAGRFLALGHPERAILAADRAWRQAGSDIPIRGFAGGLRRALFPLPSPEVVWQASVDAGVPWSLLAALAREESRWQPEALSRVGARGLMQLMPGTAREVATRRGEPPPTAEDLFDPRVSLRLGATELSRLLGVFGGQWAPAVAAYNAGEAQAKLWLAECGRGCPEELYVEIITFAATRIYTRDVLVAASVYAELYGAIPGVAAGRGTAGRAARPPERRGVRGIKGALSVTGRTG